MKYHQILKGILTPDDIQVSLPLINSPESWSLWQYIWMYKEYSANFCRKFSVKCLCLQPFYNFILLFFQVYFLLARFMICVIFKRQHVSMKFLQLCESDHNHLYIILLCLFLFNVEKFWLGIGYYDNTW